MEDTQATEVATPVEEKKSGGLAKTIGVVAGGGAAGYYANNYVTKNGIKEVISPKVVEAAKEGAKEAKAPGFTKAVKGILDDAKNTKLVTEKEAFESLKNVTAENISKLEVTAADKLHNVKITTKSGEEIVREGIKKLPGELKVGSHTGDELTKLVTGDKSALKGLVADSEKVLIGNIQKAGGMGMGIKNGGVKGNLIIFGGAIAGAFVGGKVLHAIFGGKHTKKVEEQQAQLETAPAR